MFGNRIGWGISACIVMVVSFLLYALHRQGTRPQTPTAVGLNAARWTLKPPIDGRQIATWMTEEGDASAIYQQIIRHYDANRDAYERFLTRKADPPEGKRTEQLTEEDLKQMMLQRLKWPEFKTANEGVDLLVKAAHLRGGGVFINRLDAIITYDRDTDGKYPEELSKLMRVAADAGWLVATVEKGAGNDERHKQVLQAMFSLGTQLCDERLLFVQWRAGRTLQGVARNLIPYEQDEARKKLIADFDGQWVNFARDHIESVQRAALMAMYPHAGDMAALAQSATDPTWRIEGILALGRAKYGSKAMGDIVGSKRILEKLAADPDPRIAQAATVARDLPIEEWRRIRLSW